MSSPGSCDAIERLASMMPNAWPLFFRKRSPLPIQFAAMPLIVKGGSVLLCGPTASGKTEAAVAPLFQRHFSFQRDRLSVVYVAPTKALANDLKARLDNYLGREVTGIVSRYTGDHHECKAAEGSFILLSTPEALDSLQLMQPEILFGIRAVVIDEIHFLHGKARGQQLRCVIDRICRNAAEPRSPKDIFQMIGMSATLNNMEEVAQLWLGEGSLIAKAGDTRQIEMDLVETPPSAGKAEQIAHWIEQNAPQKALVFANSRNRAHEIAVELSNKLNGSRWPVHMHIGILSRTERERVEHAMKEDLFGLCVATSTLELGIDIGEIEAVILVEPPYSINGFLQRIGRGNRRTEICRVLAIYQDEQEKEVFQALHNCARNGVLDDLYEYDRPSVKFQQLLSLIWREIRSGRMVTKRLLSEMLKGAMPQYEMLLEDMLTTGALRETHGEYILSNELMDEADARRIHSVLAGTSGMNLTDSRSGETVAHSLDGQTARGGFYSGGKIKYLEIAPSGEFYLRDAGEKEKGALAKLSAARGKKGLSRRLMWSVAEIRGIDPKRWYFSEHRLTTWGGSDYNRLLKIIFQKENVAQKVTSDEEGLSAHKWNVVPDPERTRDMAERISWYKLGKSAAGFREPTRYMRRLGTRLQHTEAVNAIPIRIFMKWLDECRF